MKSVLCVALLLFGGRSFAGWETIPPLPAPNGGFACGVVGKKIVVIGGTNWKDGTKQWLDGIRVFDLKMHEWETHGKLSHPLAYAAVANWNGDLVIAGGTTGVQSCKEVWRVDRLLKFTTIGELKEDAVLAAGGVIGKDILILGGCADPSKLTGFHGRGVRLNLDGDGISPLQPPGAVPFALSASTVLGREWFVFGGVTSNSVNDVANLSAAWSFDPRKNAWRGLRPFPIAVRGAAAVKLGKHHILIAGGFGGQPEGMSAAAFIYNAKRDAYTKTMDLPIPALVGLVRAGDFVYSLGGEDKARHRTDACFRVKVAELLAAASRN